VNNTACDQSKCTGKWAWGGDKKNICYDNGHALYSYSCGAGSGDPSTKSCSDLGWTAGYGAPQVCANSILTNGACVPASGWGAAQAACLAAGARLCTVEELQNDETKGTGCKDDCELVWAEDACTMNGVQGNMAAAGSKKCVSKPTGCQLSTTSLSVRCCADVEHVVENPTLPKGFFSAISHDYRSKACAGVPLASYSCWTDDQGTNQRMACRSDDNFVYFQACGADSSCRTCNGNWVKAGDKVGVCYSAPEGYLYKYSCPGSGKH